MWRRENWKFCRTPIWEPTTYALPSEMNNLGDMKKDAGETSTFPRYVRKQRATTPLQWHFDLPAAITYIDFSLVCGKQHKNVAWPIDFLTTLTKWLTKWLASCGDKTQCTQASPTFLFRSLDRCCLERNHCGTQEYHLRQTRACVINSCYFISNEVSRHQSWCWIDLNLWIFKSYFIDTKRT